MKVLSPRDLVAAAVALVVSAAASPLAAQWPSRGMVARYGETGTFSGAFVTPGPMAVGATPWGTPVVAGATFPH